MRELFAYTPNVAYVSEETSDEGKRKYLGSDELFYTSTTTALSQFEDKTSLTDWAERIGQEESEQISATSADAGKIAHKAVEEFLLDGKEDTDDPFARVAIDNFYSHVNLDAVGVEHPLFYRDPKDRFRVAGRYDALLKLDLGGFMIKSSGRPLDDQYVIADLKTKRSYEQKKRGDGFKLKQLPRHDKVDFLLKNCMQCAMYAATITLQTNFKEVYGEGVTGAVLVYVNEKNAKLMYINRANLNYYWNVFKTFLIAYSSDTPAPKTWKEQITAANGRYELDDGGSMYTHNLLQEIVPMV